MIGKVSVGILLAALVGQWLTVNAEDSVCSLEADPGSCRAAVTRWFYDTQTQACKTFTYGGCGGNDNNFESEEDCNRACANTSDKDEDEGPFKGCYHDKKGDRDLEYKYQMNETMDLNRCRSFCRIKMYRYMGAQGPDCYCGNNYGKYDELSLEECSIPCPNNPSTYCGGTYANAIYDTSPDASVPKPTISIEETATSFSVQCNWKYPMPGALYKVWWEADGQELSEEVVAENSTFAQLQPEQLYLDGKSMVGESVTCSVAGRYIAEEDPEGWGAVATTDEPYYIGIVVTNEAGDVYDLTTDKISLIEGQASGSVYIRPTLPVAFLKLGLSVLPTPGNDPSTCKHTGETIDQVVLSLCTLSFDQSNWKETQEVSLKAVEDFVLEGQQTVSFHMNILEPSEPFEEGDIGPHNLEVVVNEFNPSPNAKLPSNAAKSTCDPHMTTFDGTTYDNQNEGEFVFYRHTEAPFEVHTFYKWCRPGSSHATCNCAVAVKVGDDVITVDKCPGIDGSPVPANVKVYTGNDDILAKDFTVVSRNGGRGYVISLPSGAQVSIRIARRRRQFFNVRMTPSTSDYGKTEGLAGNYNDDRTDDLYTSSGQLSPRVKYPNSFSVSWRVPESETLYYGNVPIGDFTFTPDTDSDEPFCSCNELQPLCTQTGIQRCESEGEDLTDENKEKPDRESTELPFFTSLDETPEVPEWPTSDGVTEEEAEADCREAFTNLKAYPHCIDLVSPEPAIENCVADRLLSESNEYTMTALEMYKADCEELADQQLNTDLPDDIFCLNECSFQGQCVDSVCECNGGFTGPDCSISTTESPDVTVLSPCLDLSGSEGELLIPVTGAFSEDLEYKCDLTVLVNGEITPAENTKVEIVNFELLHCYFAPTTLTGIATLSVTIKGLPSTTSDELQLYDSRCQTCDAENPANLLADMCRIDGTCYVKGDVNAENNGEICDPEKDPNSWTDPNVCPEGFTGPDCSISTTESPNVISEKHCCDVATNGACHIVNVISSKFSPDLEYTCELVDLRDMNTVLSEQAKQMSSDTLQCTFPGMLRVTGYEVGVRLKNLDKGDSGGFSVYDSNCLTCSKNDGVVGIQDDKCYINGECWDGFIINPADSQLVCAPEATNSKWTPNTCDINNGGCEKRCSLDNSGDVECVQCDDGFEYNPASGECEAADEDEDVCSRCAHGCDTSGAEDVCICLEGYQISNDKVTCEDIDECADNNGGCGLECINSEGSHECSCGIVCLPGYMPSENKCIMLECGLDNGNCSHTCEMEDDKPVCSCPGRGILDPTDKICIDPCDLSKEGCEDICTSDEFFEVTCSCNEGRELQNDNKTCSDSNRKECAVTEIYDNEQKKCVDKCEQDNGGCGEATCKTTDDGKVQCNCEGSKRFVESTKMCECPRGFELNPLTDQCEDINECELNNGGCDENCTNTVGSFKCSCGEGETLSGDGKTCINPDENLRTPPDECDDQNGGCEQVCVVDDSVVTCECYNNSFVLQDDGKSCKDKCEVDNGGCEAALCYTDEQGDVQCYCPDGQQLLASEKECVEECQEGFELNLETGECIDPCDDNNGGCEDECNVGPDGAVCSCPSGGVLQPDGSCDVCEPGFEVVGEQCKDINECEREEDDCEQECENTDGGFECSCTTGELDINGKNCTDSNPCKANNGGCEHECTHVEGKEYACSCYEGYQLENNHHDCVDKCDIDNGGCSGEANCTLIGGKPTCSCEPGFVLVDETNCEDVCASTEHNDCDKRCTNENATAANPYTCFCDAGEILRDDECVDGCEEDKQGCEEECINLYNGEYECACDDTKVLNADRKSCDDKDECKEDNGNCSHTCENDDPGYHCECPEGEELYIDQRTCIEYNPCEEEPGLCTHSCVYEGTTRAYHCECDPGWQLLDDMKTCEDSCLTDDKGGCSHICNHGTDGIVCSCPDGYRLLPDDKTCDDIDECDDPQLNECDQTCDNTIGGYNCSCEEGATLDTDGTTCTTGDPCELDNGGCSDNCEVIDNKAQCSCPDDLMLDKNLKNCTHACNVDNFDCGQICVPENPARCDCNEGWQLTTDEKNCKDIDECKEETDECEGTCLNEIGGYSCNCTAGHRVNPVNGTKCDDINECEEDNGGCAHVCDNNDGGFECSCRDGYTLAADSKNCTDIPECKTSKGGCSQKCVEEEGGYHCECNTGYELQADNHTCTDIPECDTDKGGCDHLCVEQSGSFKCNCRNGYTLLDDMKSCEDKNECNDTVCAQLCENTEGSFICSCENGYELSVDGRDCTDVNECRLENGGCIGGECVNDEGGHHCNCTEGYTLDVDERRCIDTDECLPDGSAQCDHVCNNTEGSFVCSCRDGYSLADDDKTCEDDDECAEEGVGSVECQEICVNLPGAFECNCTEGRVLNTDGKTCDRVDRCETDNGGCDQICSDDAAGEPVNCSCNAGYNLNAANNTCQDIDECQRNNGGCKYECQNVPGTYRCECETEDICLDGYEHEKPTDRCTDIDECAGVEDACADIGVCVNTDGSYRCDE